MVAAPILEVLVAEMNSEEFAVLVVSEGERENCQAHER